MDLFCGASNVGVNVCADKVLCNDANHQVIKLMNKIKNCNTEMLLKQIGLYINKYNLTKQNKDGYLQLRKDYNKDKDTIKLYTLACYSFNNQIRFNRKDEFNTPFGCRSFNNKTIERFKIFASKLRSINIVFSDRDFRSFNMQSLNKNDFVYLDPPYYNSTATYNENNGWSEKDEFDLREVVIDLDSKGIKFALSNNLSKNVTLYRFATDNEFKIQHLVYDYSNCNYQKKPAKRDMEVVITNY